MIFPYTAQSAAIIKRAILAGEVISFPTDTLFALACDATNDKAIERLFALKQRKLEKTAPILVASIEKGMEYARFNESALKLAKADWPGALTLVLPALIGSKLSKLVIRDATIGIRVPNHEVALNILKDCGVPLLGTSANLTSGPNLNNAGEIEQTLGSGLAMVITGGTEPSGTASTIIKVDDYGEIILRQDVKQ